MCGICGVRQLGHGDNRAAHLFEKLLVECQIRGRHSTGVATVVGNQVYSDKMTVAASDFVETTLWQDMKRQPILAFIGHTRYSTSGDVTVRNAQPLNNRKLALVHNGLVSMAEQSEFERQYQMRTATSNDSEIILRAVMEAGQTEPSFDNAVAYGLERVAEVEAPIYALGFLTANNGLTVVCDHLRPLWLFWHDEWEVVGFASTEDIIHRAMKAAGAHDYRVAKAVPYRIYRTVEDVPWTFVTQVRTKTKTKSESRWPRPALRTLPCVGNSTPEGVGADHRTNLRESFKQYCVASVSTWEIDPNYALFNYLFRRYELSKSQEYWACYLYGVFYHPGTVFYVMQEFPEYEKVDLDRLKRWHAENWRALRYNTDRKYEKGHFVEMFESYKELIGSQTSTSQEDFFQHLLVKSDDYKVENWRRVERELRKLLRFGRYATYIYTEALARCMGMPIEADTMFLKEAKSSRMGLAIVLGWDVERVGEGKLTATEWDRLAGEGEALMHEIQDEHPELGMDHWFMESCLCAYKGYFRATKGRYLPYYLDRMLDEIGQLQHEPITSGIDWKVLYQFRRECIIPEYLGEYAKPKRWKVQKSMEHILRDTGQMIGLEPVIQRGLL